MYFRHSFDEYFLRTYRSVDTEGANLIRSGTMKHESEHNLDIHHICSGRSCY